MKMAWLAGQYEGKYGETGLVVVGVEKREEEEKREGCAMVRGTRYAYI